VRSRIVTPAKAGAQRLPLHFALHPRERQPLDPGFRRDDEVVDFAAPGFRKS
jgi:hypothetical protein